MTEAISQRLTNLNEEHRFVVALNTYLDWIRHDPQEANAHVHFQAALAALALRQPITLMEERLELCPNYTSRMRGDLKRELALALIRRREDLDRAEQLLHEAIGLHQGLVERLAVDHQALGRLHEAKGNLVDAYGNLQRALDTLRYSRAVDLTLLADTAFHTVRVTIKNGYRARANAALRDVVDLEPSWRKRWMARVMYYLPARLGVVLVGRPG